jgi:hypothetical protein
MQPCKALLQHGITLRALSAATHAAAVLYVGWQLLPSSLAAGRRRPTCNNFNAG